MVCSCLLPFSSVLMTCTSLDCAKKAATTAALKPGAGSVSSSPARRDVVVPPLNPPESLSTPPSQPFKRPDLPKLQAGECMRSCPSRNISLGANTQADPWCPRRFSVLATLQPTGRQSGPIVSYQWFVGTRLWSFRAHPPRGLLCPRIRAPKLA